MEYEHRSEKKLLSLVKPEQDPAEAAARELYSVRCGRCGVVFPTRDCRKLDHFSIYRVVCPHCGWPGRYLASELHAATPPPARIKPARQALRHHRADNGADK